MFLKKSILYFTISFCTITGYSQNSNTDSTPYLKLFKQYDKLATDDRSKGIEIANEIEKIASNNKSGFFISDALIKKAVMYYFKSDLDKSKYYALKSIQAANESGNTKVLLKAYNLVGAIYYNLADFKNSELYYIKKINLAKQFKDTIAEMGTYYNIGLIYLQQGNFLKSADYNFIALNYFKRTQDTFNILGSLQSIGFTYLSLQDVPTSLKFYKEALSLFKHYKDNYQLSGLLIDISEAYKKQNQSDSAFYCLDQALKISAKEKDNFHFSLATDAKATLYLDNKNYMQALILSKEALKINEQSKLQFAVCQNYGTISTIYTKLKTYDSALVYAKKGFRMALVFEKATIVKECAKNLSTIYENRKNADSALKYFKIYFSITDSLKTEGQLRGIAQKEFLYEKQNQENLRFKEQLLAETKLEKQKHIVVIVLVASILLLILLLIGVINYKQKQKANAQVLVQKKLLEEKNKEVADSINYASRIQKSIMPDEVVINEILPNSFVLYLPKDIVSGDFYWINSLLDRSNKTIHVIAVADCTGHGIPGAFMSLIGATILNQTLSNDNINSPADALDFLNVQLPKNIKGSSASGTIKDGMEVSMCSIDHEKMELQFSGANNNLYLIRNNSLQLFKGNKRPIGQGYEGNDYKFTNQIIPIFANDFIYMSTDGFPDQFGGVKGKKFKYKQMEDLFLVINHLPAEQQSQILKQTFMEWKGNLEQVDDVLVMGVKI